MVTGAGQGIGRAIAMSYASEGASVVVTDFNQEMGEQTVSLIRDAGGEASFVFGDVSQEDSVKAAVEFAVQTYGRLDVACNSAALLEAGGGAIVNISSNASLRGQAFNTAYAAAKSGVNLLTKSSAAEYGSQGIRINAVSPGVIRTPGVEKYFEEQPEMAEGLKKAAVMNRLGEPEEIAQAVTFLSSDRASFITGQLLSVDGGGSVK